MAAALSMFTGSSDAGAGGENGNGGTKEINQKLRSGDVELADDRELPPHAQGDDNRTPKVGDTRVWLALDDAAGGFYLKEFTLRGANNAAEVWVATGTASVGGVETTGLEFPEGDCRNDNFATEITDDQIVYLLGEFSNNIRPTDTEWFGEPNQRTGKDVLINDFFGTDIQNGAYKNNQGRDVILVDNVRDDNFYDEDNQSNLTYIAGFFTTAMSLVHDRNVITIDGFDWLHRTGENPPHEPTENLCTNAPARPFLYEGVFAHEYQHLIHSDYDPDEFNWVNEGMADLAEILTGYSDPAKHVDEIGFDSHVQSFLGWNSVANPNANPIPRAAGPENSLTVWEDQGPLEILADYGHAYYFMLYMLDRFDQAFFTSWHHEAGNGIEGLNNALSAAGSGETFQTIFPDVEVSSLVDGLLDNGAAGPAEFLNDSTEATIFSSGNAYDTAGAPPWGSDYLPVDLSAASTVEFNGEGQLDFPGGTEWTVVNGYLSPFPTSPYGAEADRSMAREVSVPNADPFLRFEHYYGTEATYDFGFVQVLDDGNWVSLPCTGTVSPPPPGDSDPLIYQEMPGYTGTAGTEAAPVTAECDLSAYAGTDVPIAFRFMTDALVNDLGWFVRNITLGGAAVGDGTTAGWDNEAFFDPAQLGFLVQFVGHDGTTEEWGDIVAGGSDVLVVEMTLDELNDGSLSAEDIDALNDYANVVAIISGVPENESDAAYFPYSLLVDGDEQADGAVIAP